MKDQPHNCPLQFQQQVCPKPPGHAWCRLVTARAAVAMLAVILTLAAGCGKKVEIPPVGSATQPETNAPANAPAPSKPSPPAPGSPAKKLPVVP